MSGYASAVSGFTYREKSGDGSRLIPQPWNRTVPAGSARRGRNCWRWRSRQAIGRFFLSGVVVGFPAQVILGGFLDGRSNGREVRGDVVLEAVFADERSSFCMLGISTTPAPPKVFSGSSVKWPSPT